MPPKVLDLRVVVPGALELQLDKTGGPDRSELLQERLVVEVFDLSVRIGQVAALDWNDFLFLYY